MSESSHFHLDDEMHTLALGAELARAASDFAQAEGVIIHLRGDLGAGKTTLTRGLLRALGVAGAVKSPTYTLVEPYELAGLIVYHFDLYRLHSPEELEFMGVRDYFQAGRLCIVEWPERGGDFLPKPDIIVTIQTIKYDRGASLIAYSNCGELILKRIDAKNISNIS